MEFVNFLHSIMRWAVLLFGVWAVINAISGVAGKKAFTAKDDKTNLFFMISCDVQLLIGLVLYFSGPWIGLLKASAGEVMKNDTARFFAVEHILMMIVALALVHIGRSSVKKAATDAAKHKKSLIFFGIAIVIILASIPWPFREAIARPLLKGL